MVILIVAVMVSLLVWVIIYLALNHNNIAEQIILNEQKIEKIILLETLISSRMVREYEKSKILEWIYDTLSVEEYKEYMGLFSNYYENSPYFREKIKEIIRRNQIQSDRFEIHNFTNNYNQNSMYYTSTNWILYEEILAWEIPQSPYTDVRAQSSIEVPSLSDLQTSGSTMTTSNWQWEIENQWITSFQYYQTSQDLKKEKKKIDPNKEIIKHLTKICKNKKWV